jgi:transcriptional regulator with GAF, ATPase, and Fis domain
LISELDLDVINVRILAASNRDLNAEVEAGRFREVFFIG